MFFFFLQFMGYTDRSFENPDVALHCGMMLRECMRHEALCKLLLQDKVAFYNLFKYVELSNFDVASDAFATFKVGVLLFSFSRD
jgi:calcium binding protein 39